VSTPVVMLATRGGGNKRAPRTCGGCGRAWAPGWQRCLFCGFAPLPKLEFVSGPLAGQIVPLQGEVTTLGSVAGNTIVLSDPAVSRKHVGIRRVGSGYELADLGSTNGVYVNGHKMPKKQLSPGDIVRVGNTELVFKQE
jgi:hypothetical protein